MCLFDGKNKHPRGFSNESNVPSLPQTPDSSHLLYVHTHTHLVTISQQVHTHSKLELQPCSKGTAMSSSQPKQTSALSTVRSGTHYHRSRSQIMIKGFSERAATVVLCFQELLSARTCKQHISRSNGADHRNHPQLTDPIIHEQEHSRIISVHVCSGLLWSGLSTKEWVREMKKATDKGRRLSNQRTHLTLRRTNS